MDDIKPTPVEATRNAIAEAIADPAPATPAPVAKDEPTAPSAEPAAPAPAAVAEPSPVAKSEDPAVEPEAKKDWNVPGERLQEEVKKRKELEAKVAELEASQPPKPEDKPTEDPKDDDEEDIDLTPAGLKALRKHGFVTKEEATAAARAEIEAENKNAEYRTQVANDMKELEGWAKEQGFPEFNAKEVNEWSEANLGKDFVQNKTTLKAAYRAMHEEAIREAEIKTALHAAGNTASAERPGAKAQVPAAAVAGPDGWKSKVAEVVDGSDN